MISPSSLLALRRTGPVLSEEAGWVVAARGGDREATLRLLARYRPPLVRVLAGITGDWAAAEDVAQEAFLQAFRRLDQLRDAGRFYPWVRRLAVRLALREMSSRRAVSLETPGIDEPAADPMPGVETRLAVDAVLAQVPADLRAALVLRELEGMEYAEIAEALEIPIGTVRSRLFSARERFRALWSELCHESDKL